MVRMDTCYAASNVNVALFKKKMDHGRRNIMITLTALTDVIVVSITGDPNT